MATETTKVVLDLDNKEFVSKLQSSIGLLGRLGDGESLSGLVSAFTRIGGVVAIATAAFYALKTAVDLTQEAEHINQINKSFEALAESAGLAADVIKNELVTAADGLADDTDILQSANKAIIAMGENASRIPEVMQIARKATVAFGGELLDNFEKINSALASGNVRMLRQYGIIIDVNKAQKDYAKSLGIGVQYLDEAGKKQAVLNAALSAAQDKFKNVDTSSLKTTENLQRISVSLSQIKETATLAWNALAGPTVSKIVEEFAKGVNHASMKMKEAFGSGTEKAEAHKEIVKENIKKYEELVAFHEKHGIQFFIDRANNLLREQQNELAKIEAQEERALQLEMKKAQAKGENKTVAAAPNGHVDTEKIKADKLKFENDLLQISKDRLDAEENYATDIEQFKFIREQEELRVKEEHELRIQEINKRAKDLGVQDTQEHAYAILEINRHMELEIAQIKMKARDDEIQSLKNLEKQNEGVAAGFTAAWKRNGAEAGASFNNFSQLGDRSFKAVKSSAVNAFQAIGDGSKGAGDAMKGFMFGALGDIATAEGELLLASGMGHTAMGSPGGPVEIAAGGALIALGSALKSMGNSSGSSAPSASGGGGGGGEVGGPGGGSGSSSAPEPQEAQKRTATINIHGNFFETDQTRTRLMEMIRESGDFTDFNLLQIGQPG